MYISRSEERRKGGRGGGGEGEGEEMLRGEGEEG